MGLKNRGDVTPVEEPGAMAGLRTDIDVHRYRQLLLEEVNFDELNQLSETKQRARLEKHLGRLLSRYGPILTDAERTAITRMVIDEALGLGVLDPLLRDPSITEIMVNGPDRVYVERAGRLERNPTTFSSEEQLYQTIDRIVSSVNRRVDESSPMVDARLATGERVNIIVPPLALDGPVITIRRFPRAFTLEQLVEMGSLDAATAQLLVVLVRARINVIVSGGTGTGKTTFLNALSGPIDELERIVTIEDSAELQLEQQHVIRLESRPPSVEGKGEVTIRDLVRNALRMRPDRIIVGEVRGGETLDMLQAMNTGHEGSLATVHANSASDAILRLQTLASMSEVELSFEALRDQINGAVDVVVHLRRYPDRSRRVAEVQAVASRRSEAYAFQPVMALTVDDVDLETGEVHATRRTHRAPDWLIERVTASGHRMPAAFARGEEAQQFRAEDA